MSDFKSSKNDIPLVWYDHYHLGKTEHLGKTDLQYKKGVKNLISVFASIGELLKKTSMFTKIRKLR